jgi:hypothetical protein
VGKKKLVFSIAVSLLILISVSCSKKQPAIPDDVIVAKIGDRIITKNDFIQRAEYTIRPPYCKSDIYLHKKIVLNSLIAEKLLAFEAGDTNKLAQNEQFKAFINGRKEQTMRQLFFKDKILSKVKLDKEKVKQMYELAGRTYRVAFVAIQDSAATDFVKKSLFDDGMPFEELIHKYADKDSIPEHEISWQSETREVMRDVFFGQKLGKDQIVGPLKIGQDHLFMKVLGWTDKMAITQNDIKNRNDEIVDYLTNKQSAKLYQSYVINLMKGKTLTFNRDTFFKLIDIMGKFYFESNKQKPDMFNAQPLKNRETLLDSMSTGIEAIRNQPLFNLNSEAWTVNDLEKEISRHPLQFRKKKFPPKEFGEQLKYAIADLIADKYITEQAYKKGYDKNYAVQNVTDTWRDSYMATYERNKILKKAGAFDGFDKDYIKITEKVLNPVVDALQQKYNNSIQINFKAFEDIKLTHIDLFVVYDNQPYQVATPSFPVVTTDNRLDYGGKIEAKGK